MSYEMIDRFLRNNLDDDAYAKFLTALAAQPAALAAQPALTDIEQYRMQMAGICTAAVGAWKEGDSIHPDYDTLAMREVARLYAQYAALAAQRDALLAANRQQAVDLLAASTREIELAAEVARLKAKVAKQGKELVIGAGHIGVLIANTMRLRSALISIAGLDGSTRPNGEAYEALQQEARDALEGK